MTALRTAGYLCIFAASMLSGFYLENNLKKRWYFLREIYEVFLFLDQEMTHRYSLIQEALQYASSHCRTEAASMLQYTVRRIDSREEGSFLQIWKDAASRLPEHLLSDEEYCMLCQSGAALCCTDPVTQKTLLKKYADRFFSYSRSAEAIYREKGRLYRSLSTAGGILIILLLI
ncbi:stage III sporulation protein AB [Parablautia sp. Marseille-Q6255]|uniref:stage III sporulation protein AB n=1 Tax=Parablautia sp. Marseille-Q6255 TaxID=3039593 RepID=UPI0024BCA2A6|nr:stage III sporulation protein AB [Parablautia sp. Marseille-Q6255]